VRGVEPKAFDHSWHEGSPLDLWDVTVDLTAEADGNFGQEGKYLYRFHLQRGDQTVTFWFSDLFARATGRGILSAFTIDAAASFCVDGWGFSRPRQVSSDATQS